MPSSGRILNPTASRKGNAMRPMAHRAEHARADDALDEIEQRIASVYSTRISTAPVSFPVFLRFRLSVCARRLA